MIGFKVKQNKGVVELPMELLEIMGIQNINENSIPIRVIRKSKNYIELFFNDKSFKKNTIYFKENKIDLTSYFSEEFIFNNDYVYCKINNRGCLDIRDTQFDNIEFMAFIDEDNKIELRKDIVDNININKPLYFNLKTNKVSNVNNNDSVQLEIDESNRITLPNVIIKNNQSDFKGEKYVIVKYNHRMNLCKIMYSSSNTAKSSLKKVANIYQDVESLIKDMFLFDMFVDKEELDSISLQTIDFLTSIENIDKDTVIKIATFFTKQNYQFYQMGAKSIIDLEK